MKWPLTFYVDRLSPGNAGEARGPVIFILKDYRYDVGLYQHEVEHVRQWFFTLGLHSILYKLVPRYRLYSEVRAYREQAKYYYDDRRPLFAKFIAESYNLNVTQAQALEMLK